MFNDGVEEQVVKERTGHRSDAVRVYKRTAEHLLQTAEKAAIGDDRPVHSKFQHDQEPLELTIVSEKSGAQKLVDVLKHVNTGSSKVKRVKFEVQFHDKQ